MNNKLPLTQVSGRVAFDIDGVFGNIMELFIRMARDLYQIDSIRYEDITEYYLYDCLPIEREIIDRIIEKVLDYPHALEMNPFDHSVRVLTEYARKYPLIFITARKKAEPVRDWVTRTLVPGGSPKYSGHLFPGASFEIGDLKRPGHPLLCGRSSGYLSAAV